MWLLELVNSKGRNSGLQPTSLNSLKRLFNEYYLLCMEYIFWEELLTKLEKLGIELKYKSEFWTGLSFDMFQV